MTGVPDQHPRIDIGPVAVSGDPRCARAACRRLLGLCAVRLEIDRILATIIERHALKAEDSIGVVRVSIPYL
jgi:hypothetical protein